MTGLEDDSDKKVKREEIESEDSREIIPPATFGQKVNRHCVRFWWVHVIIFCVVFLIVALCLVYVGMPHIAQHGVNESSLEIQNIAFTDPSSTTIVLTQKGILHSPSRYTPTLDPFNASSYLVTNGTYADEPMVIIPMPKIHARHPQGNVSVEGAKLSIYNLDRLTDYATAVLSNEYVTTALVGKTKLHEGKLPTTNINYNSTSTYKGLNGLAGFNVTNVKINPLAKAGETNLIGDAYIPNPSGMTIVMGNVTLILSTVQAGVIGNTTIENMVLVPGNNTLPLTGIIDQTLVSKSLNAFGYMEMGIVGNSSIYNGQHLTYYEKALASNKLSLELNVAQIISDSLKDL